MSSQILRIIFLKTFSLNIMNLNFSFPLFQTIIQRQLSIKLPIGISVLWTRNHSLITFDDNAPDWKQFLQKLRLALELLRSAVRLRMTSPLTVTANESPQSFYFWLFFHWINLKVPYLWQKYDYKTICCIFSLTQIFM